MKLELHHFKTKVAQRIVALFFLCALLPASTLAVIAYVQVRSELQSQRDSRLRQGISAATQGLVERLQSIQAEMDLLAQSVLDGGSTLDADDLRRVTDLSLVTAGEAERLVGRLAQLPAVSADTVEAMSSGEAILRTVPAAGGRQADILMAVPLDRGDAARGLLWARAADDSLFSTARVYATDLGLLAVDEQDEVGFCVLDPELRPLTCVGALRPWLGGDLPVPLPADSALGPLGWSQGGVGFSGRYRRAFLRGQFHSDSWTLVVAESDRSALAPLADFRRTFFQGILLTLMVVLLLSVVQVRRSMEPLAKLKQATVSIAAKDFEARVRIASGDELEDLANSFNDMAEQVGGLVEELEALSWGTITTLARTIDAKSPWTAGHSERVARMSLSIAQVMGLSQKELDTIHRGGLLHDIGKIGVPVYILDKPGKLSDEEFQIMKDHVTVGARILEPLAALSDVIPIVLYHHEKYDGSGYPKGLKGTEIHPLARITAIADAFDAIQSDRPYRAGRSGDKSAQVIAEASGTEFDAEMVEAFLKVMALRDQAPAGWERQPLRELAMRTGEGG